MTYKLYFGGVSRNSDPRDIEDLFSSYGRIRDFLFKGDFGFVEYESRRDAEDARLELDNYRFDGRRLVVEPARDRGGGGRPRRSRGRGRSRGRRRERSYSPRGSYRRAPPAGDDKCYNCGKYGHWASSCPNGDWSNKCYRCGRHGHLRRDCMGSFHRSLSKLGSSRSRDRYSSRSLSRRRSRSRSRSRSRKRSPYHSRSISRNGSNSRSKNRLSERSRSRSRMRNSPNNRDPSKETKNRDRFGSEESKGPDPTINDKDKERKIHHQGTEVLSDRSRSRT